MAPTLFVGALHRPIRTILRTGPCLGERAVLRRPQKQWTMPWTMSCEPCGRVRGLRAMETVHWRRIVFATNSASSRRSGDNVMAELALLGGDPIRTQPFPPYNSIGAEELAATEEVVRSGVLS